MGSPEIKNIRIIALMPGNQLFGSERGNIEAYLALRKAGADVIVAITNRHRDGGDVGRRVRELGFTTISFPYGGPFNKNQMVHLKSYRNRQIKRLWENSRLLMNAIRKHEATHVLTGSTLAFLYCAIGLTVNRIPLIYRMGDAPAPQSSFQLFTWKWITRRAHAIVAISDFIAQTAASHSRSARKKTIVIRNALTSRASFETQKSTPSVVPPKKSLQLVYVGQITPQKGLNELIEGLLQLNDPDVGCWIIGGSQYTVDFETQLRERVKQSASKSQISFFGFLENPMSFYAAADWHIAPSKYEEPLGNIVQEAKATGTPSIVSPLGGLPELIEHEVDGIILSEISASAIQKTIRQLQTTPDIWAKYGLAARASLEEKLNKEVFEQQWCEVLNNIT